MRVVIMTDLEGISGVDSIAMMEQDGEGYRFACARLMHDVFAAVEGALSGGAEEIVVFDGHGSGQNFVPGALHPRAVLGEKGTLHSALEGAGAFMLIGAHAMAGTQNGFLDHTQSSATWFNYSVNGKKTGEIGQCALMCGRYRVPFVTVSGDEKACLEAAALLGEDIALASIKRGVGRNKAVCLHSEEALRRITAAAEDGVRRAREIRPYKLIMPLEIGLELCRSDYCDRAANQEGVRRLDARTLCKTVYSFDTLGEILF